MDSRTITIRQDGPIWRVEVNPPLLADDPRRRPSTYSSKSSATIAAEAMAKAYAWEILS